MSEIQWSNPTTEIRIGDTPPIGRFALAATPRASGAALGLHPSTAPVSGISPCALFPLVDHAGSPIAASVLHAAAPAFPLVLGTLVLPRGHQRMLTAGVVASDPEVLQLAWLVGCPEDEARGVQESVNGVAGVLVTPRDQVVSLGSAFTDPLYLQRLPRLLLTESKLVADNTDATVSMGYLLEQFVRQFGDEEDALPHVRIATGYLYAQGLARVLGLLKNPKVESLHILFSGKTDRSTAAVLTAALEERLAESAELADADSWARFRAAADAGRFKVRVYTDAFLHAKLFLAFNKLDNHARLQHSLAVVGSSNVSGSGLSERGNLELNVALQDAAQNTELYRWFEGRWEEGSDPQPDLLEILDRRRPQPDPTFQTEGLDQVFLAGKQGRLVNAEAHLAYLADAYRERMVDPAHAHEPAFPSSDLRRIRPSLEQEVGVKALARRLSTARLAFLADGVGIGKTVTAIGTAWYLRRIGQLQKAALIAPKKLWTQWAVDGHLIDAPDDIFERVNRHLLERMEDGDAAERLVGFDLLVVEEAAESLRSRSNRLWQHLRSHLRRNPACRILMISATPWNNRREDILNYLLLGWNDGRLLAERYPALDRAPLASLLPQFMIQPVGGLPATAAVRWFDELPIERYRQIFDATFVQRTRSSLADRYNQTLDFPERRVHPQATQAYEPYDALFVTLRQALDALQVPYREPYDALLRAAVGLDAPPLSNLHRSFLIHLYKRAESSTFALAVSLATVERRLLEFRATLEKLADEPSPRASVEEWLRSVYVKLDPDDDADSAVDVAAIHDPATKAKLNRLSALLGALDDAATRAMLHAVISQQIAPDLDIVRPLRTRISHSLEDRAPKDLALCRLAREAFGAGHKPLLIAGFADTATRFFVRLASMLPDARIGLALGGDEAWVTHPMMHDRSPLGEAEWRVALEMDPAARREELLLRPQRAERRTREHVLAAFAPNAQRVPVGRLALLRGEIDILVGSEAIGIGQNLQDSTCLIHLDMPWNPMVLEQRIGRIDRRGGGRVDPEKPTGRRIIDVHYCWSSAAVEQEVELRDRLKKKATQAIDDTNFDELLLYELSDKVAKVRAARQGKAGFAGEEKHLAEVLGATQQAMAERQNEVFGVPPGGGSELDALDALALWRSEHEGVAAPAPVIAAGMDPAATAAEGLRWLLTLEMIPFLNNNNPAGPPQLHHFGIRDGATTLSRADMEVVIRRLADGGDPMERPDVGRSRWNIALSTLDAAIQDWRRAVVTSHNAEVRLRVEGQSTPAARRNPSQQLQLLVQDAKEKISDAMAHVSDAVLEAQEEKINFLFGDVLEPARANELLVDQAEGAVSEALRFIVAFPKQFLEGAFDTTFEQLCGARFAARNQRQGIPPQQLSLLDSLWVEAQVRVIATTWCAV